jgi:hypothetical protein
MDVLVTPDVISRLGIASASIHNDGEMIPSLLFAFSKTHITFISPEKPRTFVDPVFVYLQTRIDTFSFPVAYESTMQTTTKHWISSFVYSQENISSPLHESWISLLDISRVQRLRADVRISATKQNLHALHIDEMANEVILRNSRFSASIQNLSFSGARLLFIENGMIEGDDKVVIKMQFTSPSEIASLRSVVLRKQVIDIAGTSCIDMAVRFLEPVDLVLRSRLAGFFQNHPDFN